MQHVIDKIVSHPWMVGLLAVSFLLSMIGFWARIRRDERNRRNNKPDAK
jgi:hypothetical protein